MTDTPPYAPWNEQHQMSEPARVARELSTILRKLGVTEEDVRHSEGCVFVPVLSAPGAALLLHGLGGPAPLRPVRLRKEGGR